MENTNEYFKSKKPIDISANIDFKGKKITRPIMTTVVFEKDQELCFDGINTRLYKQGQSYKATSPQENLVFLSMIDFGIAKEYKDQVEQVKPVKEIKVSKPKSKK